MVSLNRSEASLSNRPGSPPAQACSIEMSDLKPVAKSINCVRAAISQYLKSVTYKICLIGLNITCSWINKIGQGTMSTTPFMFVPNKKPGNSLYRRAPITIRSIFWSAKIVLIQSLTCPFLTRQFNWSLFTGSSFKMMCSFLIKTSSLNKQASSASS